MKSTCSRLWRLVQWAAASASVMLVPSAFAFENASAEQPATVAEFLEESCFSCHDAFTQEGNLRLDTLSFKLEDRINFLTWERILERVHSGEMPPDEQLAPAVINPFVTELTERLQSADRERIDRGGRVSARRLTNAQYERTVNGLLGIELPLASDLPVDAPGGTFATVSDGQQISDHSMAAYLDSADRSLDGALAAVSPRAPYKARLDWTQLARDEKQTNRQPEGRPEHQDIVSWSTSQNFYGRMESTAVAETGRYRIRIRVQAVNPPGQGRVWCSLRSGACSGKDSTLYWIDCFEATNTPSEHKFDAWIHKGHMLELRPNDRGLKKAPIRGGNSVSAPRGTIEPLGFAGVAIKWIEIERIDPDPDKVRELLFDNLKVEPRQTTSSASSRSPVDVLSSKPKDDLGRLVHRFASRAFRLPLTNQEVLPYINLSLQTYEKTGSLADGAIAGYRAILCSPRFLYFEEPPGKLGDHAIASRLSYFLWGTSPDAELTRLADEGVLGQPDVLRRQTERLLNDSRSDVFVREFTEQWLKLDELDATTPDEQLYPEYDDILHHSLRPETHAFVANLFAHDLSVENIVDSDFTFVNSRLARHYGLEWPGGVGIRQVFLSPADKRGGLITHASVLKVTANGTTTSPILRGVWMLERIMGQHVPVPPANVPAVEPDIRGATSIREQLDKHRELDSCASCHVHIDPPGFALESYDVIGGYRERYRVAPTDGKRKWAEGSAVDPAYSLASGEHFDNLRELQLILKADPEQLAGSLASHLVTYATGAAPTFADRPELAKIVDTLKTKNFGVRAIIHEVVQSEMFRSK